MQTGLVRAAMLAGGFAVRRRFAAPSRAEERLAAIEKRLTDTQDVLIALSEKCDRLERLLQRQDTNREES